MEVQCNCPIGGFFNKRLSQLLGFFFELCQASKHGEPVQWGFGLKNIIIMLWLLSFTVSLVLCRKIMAGMEFPAEVKQNIRLQCKAENR